MFWIGYKQDGDPVIFETEKPDRSGFDYVDGPYKTMDDAQDALGPDEEEK